MFFFQVVSGSLPWQLWLHVQQVRAYPCIWTLPALGHLSAAYLLPSVRQMACHCRQKLLQGPFLIINTLSSEPERHRCLHGTSWKARVKARLSNHESCNPATLAPKRRNFVKSTTRRFHACVKSKKHGNVGLCMLHTSLFCLPAYPACPTTMKAGQSSM